MGCAGHGVVGDGSSISYGPSRYGAVIEAARLPIRGTGYWMPPRWSKRGLRYGTDELVSVVVHTGKQLDKRRPGTVFSVGDLSRRRGGRSAWHRSHQTGRDVDVIYLSRDAGGKRHQASRMLHFGADGKSFVKGQPETLTDPVYTFDDDGNWQLIKALLENPVAEVQYVFMSDDLKQRVIDHAISIGEPDEIVLRAGYILHQPSDSLAHDDHMHVRIFCQPTDLALGCVDFGVLRWHKKDYKYEQRPARTSAPRRLARVMRQPIRLMLALSALPFRGFAPR